MPSFRQFLGRLLAALGACSAVHGATFLVDNNLDSGPGSLRQAILDANASPGADRISFQIPGAGVHNIGLRSDLPDVSEAVEIDGSSQPGYAGTPVVALQPGRFSGATETRGLKLTGTGIVVRALAINSFHTDGNREIEPGDALVISGPGGNRIVGCTIGLPPDGTISTAFPGFINRGAGITIDNSPNNTIGGIGPGEGNAVASYSLTGIAILLRGPASTGNLFLGNRINMDLAATQLPRSPGRGIVLSNAPGNTVGGLDAGARNLIYGDNSGVEIAGDSSRQNLVLGNWFGLKADGSQIRTAADFPAHGIRLGGHDNLVGGSQPGARNVIGGGGFGIIVGGSSNVVAGNYLGTDPTGKIAVPNSTGIYVSGDANRIGGIEAGAGNLISGNGSGISLPGNSNVVQGNWIGTDATGLLAIPNGKTNSGNSSVAVTGSYNLVGGTAPGARNVISGNDSAGVDVIGATAQFNRIEGNWIGVAADGAKALPNRNRGVQILGASHTTIGGEAPGAGNEVANNSGAFHSGEGIFVGLTFGSAGSKGTNNVIQENHIHHNAANGVGMLAGAAILGNSIHDNGKLAIDRGMDGVTKNTTKGEYNYPVLTSVHQGSTVIEGTLNAKPNTRYLLQFYANSAKDGSGNGELERNIGSVEVTTDLQGNVAYNVELEFNSGEGSWISATATPFVEGFFSDEGLVESSEACLTQVVGPPIVKPKADLAVSVGVSSLLVPFEAIVTFQVTVTNKGPAAVDSFGVFVGLPFGWDVKQHTEPVGTTVAPSSIFDPGLNYWVINTDHLDPGQKREFVFELDAAGRPGDVKFFAAIVPALTPDPDLSNNEATQTINLRLPQPLSLLPASPGSSLYRIQFPDSPFIQLRVAGGLPAPTQPGLWRPVPPGQIFRQGGIATFEVAPQGVGAPPLQFYGLSRSYEVLPHFEISQLSFNLDGVKTPFSSWGSINVHWKPELDVTYFNLRVGDDWAVQNLPLPAIDGIGVEQEIEVPFKIGAGNAPVTQIQVGLSLTTGPSDSPPETAVGMNVQVRNFQIHSGEQGGAIVYAPPAVVVGGLAETPAKGKPGFPNPEQGTNECAPAAILNSIQYLDLAFNLGLPREQLTIEKMKEAVQWTPAGAPVGNDPAKAAWVASKRDYMRPHGLPINTVETANIGIAMNALNKCYDVEMRVTGHVVCVRAIVPFPDGRYLILVSHDTDQGHPGGTVVEPWFYTPATGKVIAPGWTPDFRQFVIEYPDGH